jgi:hypothetical protein
MSYFSELYVYILGEDFAYIIFYGTELTCLWIWVCKRDNY